MVRPGRERLSGTVEADETYVGGEEDGVFGRQTQSKTVVAIAVEIHSPRGFGRVRMHPLAGVAAADLRPCPVGPCRGLRRRALKIFQNIGPRMRISWWLLNQRNR
jgi:hypothetical protein